MSIIVTNIEVTPNPDALKFVTDQKLLEKGTRSFSGKTAARHDILASALFAHRHIETVFYMDKFVTVSKNPDISWSMIMEDLKKTIESVDLDALHAGHDQPADPTLTTEDAMLDKVQEILKVRVLPYLANDGGSLQVLGMEGYQLKIRYQGACGSCPSSSTGTLNAIQAMLRHTVDPKIEVITA
ncbi:MAG: NifU family protein [Bacteroidetes bacterium]|nr:NifU family protein [Bacteroidota bacterium]